MRACREDLLLQAEAAASVELRDARLALEEQQLQLAQLRRRVEEEEDEPRRGLQERKLARQHALELQVCAAPAADGEEL
jgi:hypothetical protein